MTSITVICPDCKHEIRLGSKPRKYEKLTCPNCWAYLEVVSVEPLELAWETVDENEDSDFGWTEEDDIAVTKG